jgi:hypothetical protein
MNLVDPFIKDELIHVTKCMVLIGAKTEWCKNQILYSLLGLE